MRLRPVLVALAALAALAAPIVIPIGIVGLGGCPSKGQPSSTGAASSSSPTVSVATSTASTDVAAATGDATHEPTGDEATDESAEGDSPDAALDASLGDASPDAPADGDARPRADAAGDAPLLGTKTFPDETAESGFRYVTAAAAKVHKAPKDGKAFVSLPKGTQVWLVARLFDWYRVRFVDPSTEQARQGWIYLTTVVGPRRKDCPEGWIWHDQDGGWCERECTRNSDCKALAGYKCSGTGCFYAVVE